MTVFIVGFLTIAFFILFVFGIPLFIKWIIKYLENWFSSDEISVGCFIAILLAISYPVGCMMIDIFNLRP